MLGIIGAMDEEVAKVKEHMEEVKVTTKASMYFYEGKLNGQEVTLRMERQIENTDLYAPYKEETYKVKVMFEAEW